MIPLGNGDGHSHAEECDECACEPTETSALLCGDVDFSKVPVYPLVHEIRIDIVAHIDTPLTYDQLIAPDSTYTIIRPLTDKYIALQNPSVVFCLLLNRVQFMSDSAKLSIATLSESRATLCEIIAIRVLRGWSERSLHLATVLLTPWPLFQGAPNVVVAALKEDGEDEVLEHSATALEMAIISASKRFIRSASCQKVIEGIWSGKIIYTSVNTHAFIRDSYKQRPIQIYNPHKAPILDHYRLKVPKIRAILEYVNFLILFVLYIATVEHIETHTMNTTELVFIIYAMAFSLDKAAAMREHGLKVFASSLVNGFDIFFVVIFCVYLAARLIGFWTHNEDALNFGEDLLAVGAVFMFPRMVFMTLANNLMILSIRSMLSEFFFLMSVGIVCFLGFVYAMGRLAAGTFKVGDICWWMLNIYFGLDATGFQQSSRIHPVLGPLLMVAYAFLSNTLLLTVAVAILGNTFAIISQDAAAESMFRKAVATIEGVKGDAVFSYQLPFNILAIVVLYPLSFILNARWFHKVNVLMIRVTNLPVLLLIGLYDRQRYQDSSLWDNVCDYADHTWGKITAAVGFDHIAGNRMDIETVFEAEREYGSYYDGWEDEEVFEEDETPEMGDDNAVLAEAGAVQDSLQATTPERTMFPRPQRSPSTAQQSSPRSPGRRVATGLQTANATAMAGAGLGRSHVRRGSLSVYGPSPLAQLFVGGDSTSHATQRQRTVNVGSLPATSSFPAALGTSISPHRQQRLSFAGPSRSTTRPSLSLMEDTIEERPMTTSPADEPSLSRSLSPTVPNRLEAAESAEFPERRMPSYGSFQDSKRRSQVQFQPPPPILRAPRDAIPGDTGAASASGGGASDDGEDKGMPKKEEDAEEGEVKERHMAHEGTPKKGGVLSTPPTTSTRLFPDANSKQSAEPTSVSETIVPTEPSGRSSPESSQLVAVTSEPSVPPKLRLPQPKLKAALTSKTKSVQGRKASPSSGAGAKTASPLMSPAAPIQKSGQKAGNAPTTASELLDRLESEQHDKKSESSRTAEALRAIEARQARIEGMLLRLMGDGDVAGTGARHGGVARRARNAGASTTERERNARVGSGSGGRTQTDGKDEEEDEHSAPVSIKTPRLEDPHDTFDDYD